MSQKYIIKMDFLMGAYIWELLTWSGYDINVG